MISTLMTIKDKYIKNFSLCRAYRVHPVSISALGVSGYIKKQDAGSSSSQRPTSLIVHWMK